MHRIVSLSISYVPTESPESMAYCKLRRQLAIPVNGSAQLLSVIPQGLTARGDEARCAGRPGSHKYLDPILRAAQTRLHEYAGL